MSSSPANPVDIAREAFRQLATRRVAPTPDAYREAYDAIAGTPPARTEGAETVLAAFASYASNVQGDMSTSGRRLAQLLRERDWDGCSRTLVQIADRAGRRPQIALDTPLADDDSARQLRELLQRTLTFAVASLLAGSPRLSEEAEALGAAVRQASTQQALADVAARLKQLCYQIEIRSGDIAETQELLLRLFRLLLGNVGELLEDGSWMRGQVESVQELISGPLDQRALEDATRNLKEVIFKQGQLRNSIGDVKATVKNMMKTFIDRLGSVATSTDDFQQKIGGFTERISRATDIVELNRVLDEVLVETRLLQSEALASRDNMIAAQQEAEDAERKIAELEGKLREMSELAREDQLTGSLNRRGLDDIFTREAARADRRDTPMCIALLDLDDFKRLNDTHGHMAGDAALRHLVRVVKSTLRSIDAIARFGGEEFLIVMPETTAEDAAAAMVRLQRELTKHFFLHENEKMLITFSAGVALRHPDEDQEAVVRRADQAMYQAKHEGKNRVVIAR
ncbi:MAG TPA: diguanylate cyclase [Telluria sp.]